MPAAPTSPRKLVLLIGTVKGVFLYESDERRTDWRLSGPHLGGWEVFSVCADERNGRILAGTGHFMHGPTIRTSRDAGATWEPVQRDPAFATGATAELKHIWQIVPGHASQPGTWYAGVDDAALFVSRDDAQTWSELTGLTSHPTRPRWMPGFGGLCLHSILVDPTNAQRLWVGISAVGVFRSDDAGEHWKLCNEGLPNVAPEFVKDPDMGRCVHKMVLDPERPGVLYIQYHGGVFKSEDAAESWTRISTGLPHEFGFPMAITARGDLFIVPLLSDENRVVPDGALKVWRSRDRGRTWRAMTAGLPQREHFVGVLRDAMTADRLSPAGVYLGTTGGELFYSKDDGDTWEKLPASFPRITCLRVWAR
ncbi:WD40/YVTN/BNR-like repeat-containing protein [Horticoccus sp. 23ND18S-11]|uniref:WD40/YVTN/BNR-like repeat-containing protein n=1 Tax=Horticoccus sp. 23ND18S-11 TaxID=3391832 RepID=UPI0039C9B183